MQVTGNLRVKRGIYQMVFDYQDADGKRRQKSESTGLPEKGNKRRAQKMLEERMEELSKLHTASLEAKNVLFLSFMNSWLDDTMSYKVQPNTLSQYKMIFNGYIAKYKPFHGVKIQDVTPALIQSYYNNELRAGLSSNTVHKHHANIHKCLAYAVRLGFIPSNPSDQTELPPKKKYTGAKAYTPEQTKELLQIFHKDPLETPVYIAATYGLRRSEVCGLRWADVDFDAGIIYVRHTAVVDNGKIIYADHTKTATSNRQLPLTQNMRVYLLETKKRQEANKQLLGNSYIDSGYICTYSNGAPMRPDYVTNHFKAALKEAGFQIIRFHDLRHSVVYALRKGNCDVKNIQAWLGHSDITTTLNVYGHVLNGDMDQLGQVMDNIFSKGSKAS